MPSFNFDSDGKDGDMRRRAIDFALVTFDIGSGLGKTPQEGGPMEEYAPAPALRATFPF